MRTLLYFLLALGIPTIAEGRLEKLWTYEKMVEQSDLVLIAKSKSSRETKERGALPEWPAVKVIGVETTFEVRTIFKGDKTLKNFILHHYRQTKPDKHLQDTPAFVSFEHNKPRCFLLFLKLEPDGRYAPVTGQTDPAVLSVLKLDAVVH